MPTRNKPTRLYRRAADLLPKNSSAHELLNTLDQEEEQNQLMANYTEQKKRTRRAEDLAAKVAAISDDDLFGPMPAPAYDIIQPTSTKDIAAELSRLCVIPDSSITDDELTALSDIDPIIGTAKREAAYAARKVAFAVATDPSNVSRAASRQLQQVSNAEMVTLFDSLRINLNARLGKNDTMSLLTAMLTCNEAQINALLDDPRVPIALKIIAKRLVMDMRVGDMEAIEKLWDRVFGKGPMVQQDPSHLQLPESPLRGILPDTPVSREAYYIIRERIIGKE